jgi:transposase InsO family protein
MRYEFIQQQAGRYPVRRMCEVLEVSRGGYYGWLDRSSSRREREDRRLTAHIRSIHREYRGLYGSPRIHRELRRRGIRCSRKRVARLMRQEGLKARRQRRYRVTTQAAEGHSAAPNLLNRRFTVTSMDEVWVGDLTYLWTNEGWLYLAALMDLCSRRIVGWAVSDTIDDDLTLRALDSALQNREPGAGLLHHSDRGSQYTSGDYQDRLQERGFQISMSRKGNPWDNAPMESFFSTLKIELGDHFSSRAAARTALFDYIEVFYNRRRMHSSLDHRSPVAFELAIQRTDPHCAPAVEAAVPAEIASRLPPALGKRSAFPTAPTTSATTPDRA